MKRRWTVGYGVAKEGLAGIENKMTGVNMKYKNIGRQIFRSGFVLDVQLSAFSF